MALKVNQKALEHLRSLVSEGKVDRESPWDFTTEDIHKMLGKDGSDWSNYSQNHLAVDTSAAETTQEHSKYPGAKNDTVYRSGVIAAKERAAAQHEQDIVDAADGILQLIDKKKEVQAKRIVFCQLQLPKVSAGQLPSEMVVLPLGQWAAATDTSGNRIAFEVTPQHVKWAVDYLKMLKARNPNFALVIDADHATHDPSAGPAYAYGWMVELFDGAERGLMAKVNWTLLGQEALTKDFFKFFSPTLLWELTDIETGKVLPFAVVDGALTNQPMLERIPAVLAKKILLGSQINNGGSEMKELIALVRTWVGKSETATEDELKTAFNAKTH